MVGAVGVAEEGVEDPAVGVSLLARSGGAEEAAAHDVSVEVDELDDAARVVADCDGDEGAASAGGRSLEEEEVAQVGARGRGNRAALGGEVVQRWTIFDRGHVDRDAQLVEGGEGEREVGGLRLALADEGAQRGGELFAGEVAQRAGGDDDAGRGWPERARVAAVVGWDRCRWGGLVQSRDFCIRVGRGRAAVGDLAAATPEGGDREGECDRRCGGWEPRGHGSW